MGNLRLKVEYRTESPNAGVRSKEGRESFGAWSAEATGETIANLNLTWAAMRKGEAVPAEFLAKYARFLAEKRADRTITPETISEPAPYVVEEEWKHGWQALEGATQDQVATHRSLPKNDNEVKKVAYFIAKELGRMVSKTPGLPPGQAVGRGLATMGVGLPELEGFLLKMPWRIFPVIAVMRDAQGAITGTTVFLPLTKAKFGALTAGRDTDFSIEPTDIIVPSRHIWAFAMCHDELGGKLTRAKKTLAVTKLMTFQVAMQSKPLFPNGWLPWIAGYEAVDVNSERAKAYGALSTRVTNAKNGFRIMLLAPPNPLRVFRFQKYFASAGELAKRSGQAAQYMVLVTMVFMYQMLFRGPRREMVVGKIPITEILVKE